MGEAGRVYMHHGHAGSSVVVSEEVMLTMNIQGYHSYRTNGDGIG
jgi:hypothetical protein